MHEEQNYRRAQCPAFPKEQPQRQPRQHNEGDDVENEGPDRVNVLYTGGCRQHTTQLEAENHREGKIDGSYRNENRRHSYENPVAVLPFMIQLVLKLLSSRLTEDCFCLFRRGNSRGSVTALPRYQGAR